MPIRMTEDDPQNTEDRRQPEKKKPAVGGGGGGGSSSGGVNVLAILSFAFRHPILSLIVLAIGGLFLLFSGGDEGTTPAPEPVEQGQTTTVPAGPRRATGAVLDQKVYDQALVHEPLAEGNLPRRVSLREYAPPRRSQGEQGSCVGWATSYAARTILHARQTGADPKASAFSPSFAYNQVAFKGCDGTYLVRALNLLQKIGDLPLASFGYDPRSCRQQPDGEQKSSAARYRIAGYTRLSLDAEDYRTNALAVKQHLAQGAPVVIGMQVGGSFETAMEGKRVWHPTKSDYAFRGEWGGHAMALIGYDDAVEGGAFELMNSWGGDWGEDGIGLVRYPDFDHFVQEAYGLYPMGDARAEAAPLKVRFGLVENTSHGHIELAPAGGLVFRTVTPIRKGTRFKVELANSRPVYAYLFGQETDGSSYVLFPYTKKHSPYCGTTGTRLFPRKQSLTADQLGTRDSVAVVLAPAALDFKALNDRINGSAGASYADKLRAALGASLAPRQAARVRDGVVAMEGECGAGQVQALVLEFDKR